MDEIVLFNKITELYTSVNTDLAERPVIPGTLLEQIAWVRDGANETPGSVVKFPFPWFSDVGGELNPSEELASVAPEMVNLMATIREYGQPPRSIARGTQLADMYGLLERFAPMMLAAAARLQSLHLATLLGEGEAATSIHAYDGLPFFSTTKRINPNKVLDPNTFSNYFSSLRLDKNGLNAMIDYLEAVPGPDGLPLDFPGVNYIACSTQDQYSRACDLLQGENIAQAVGNAAASQSNKGLMGRAIPVKMNMLRRWNSGRAWYGFRVASPVHRPIIFSLKEAPSIIVEGLNPAEHVRTTRNLIKYLWRGFWGVDYGMAQLAGKAVEPAV